MNKIWTIILTIILTIIALLLIAFSYLLIKNPLGLGDVIKSSVFNIETQSDYQEHNGVFSSDGGFNNSDYDHPLLNEEQEKRAADLGIDTKKIPTKITEEQKECGARKLGEERIVEIMNGEEPTTIEILKLSTCL